MSNQAPSPALFDFSSLAAKKKSFRKLVQAAILLTVADFLCCFAFPLPEGFQIATEFEAELVPPFRATAHLLQAAGLLGVWVWGIVELWHFKAAGLIKIAIATFFPDFLINTTASASTAITNYVATLENTLDGMLLLMGWANLQMFAPDNSGLSTGPVDAHTEPTGEPH